MERTAIKFIIGSLMYALDDVRLMFENDVRFTEQFNR